MLTTLALLILPTLAPPPQELAIQQGVQDQSYGARLGRASFSTRLLAWMDPEVVKDWAALTPQPQEAANQQGVQRELRIHSLNGLADSEVGWIRLSGGGSIRMGSRYPTEAERAANPKLTGVPIADGRDLGPDPERVHDWADLAARFCEPALDPTEERIQPDDQGYLIAYLRPAQHAWLENFLALQHDPAINWIAEATVQLYSVPPGVLETMNLEGSATLLADAQAIVNMGERLVAKGAELVVAPKLSFFPNQRSNMSILDEVAYVKTYELRIIEPGAVEIADPIVDVIKEGQVVSLRAIQVADALYGLEIESVITEIERPIPTKKMRLSPVHPTEVEIGLPQVRTATVNATVRLTDGSGVMLIASGLAKDRDLAVVLSFKRAPLPPQTLSAPER